MSSFIDHVVDQYMSCDKKTQGYWSLQEICMKVTEQYGVQAGGYARTYILQDVMQVYDEEKYIDNSIKAARKKEMTNNIFSKIKLPLDNNPDGEV